MITEFQNEHRWLSNFAPVKIKLDGLEFPSVEHAYMSAKSDDAEWKKFCSNPNNKAGDVKRQSRNIVLKDDWSNIKIDVMKECVTQKFSQEPYRTKLLETGTQHIQEGNRWNDKFWGVCLKTNKGENHIGRLIMDVRSVLVKNAVSGSRFQSAYAQYWDMVKDIIDEEGWVYTKEAPHMLDAYFESNTGKPIEFQKSFGKSGDNPHWLTRGSRWRPSELP